MPANGNGEKAQSVFEHNVVKIGTPVLGVLLLIAPSFLKSNSNIKNFLQNISIWIGIILVLLTIMFFFRII